MTQATKPQGQEGGLAPALLEWHLISGGKPAFPTLRLPSRLIAFVHVPAVSARQKLVDQTDLVALRRAQEYLWAQNKSSPFTRKP